MTPPRPLVAGNWKMNGVGSDLDDVRTLTVFVEQHALPVRVALCPPATLISRLAERLEGLPIEIGAQDCSPLQSGAYTGDIAAEMLVDAGARLVILGHSERRRLHRETSAEVAAKVAGALRAGLEPIVCVGESLAERDQGRAAAVVAEQLRGSLPDGLAGSAFAIAYEPVWAIGSGRVPAAGEIEAMHHAIRGDLIARFGDTGRGTPILYGGSVNPANARAILSLAEVGGALVGGASLKAADFIAILAAA